MGRALRGMVDADGAIARWRISTLPDSLDVRSAQLADSIADIRPDAVLHLAGLTSVAESFARADAYFDVNFGGTWNLLKALRAGGFEGRFLYVSSGDCYGMLTPEELPAVETRSLRPCSPYAVSKVAAEALCYQWSQTERLDAVIARPFNHVGPGQDERFALSSFARQVAQIARGAAEPRIFTGDLGVTRDLTDVRDVVRAYFALLESGRTGEVYNVGSGRETRLSDVLDALLATAGITAQIVTDPKRLRKGEQRRAAADVRKIARDTGWSSSIPMSRTLADMIDDWKKRIPVE